MSFSRWTATPEAKRTYTGNFPDIHFELADIRAVMADQVQRRVQAAGPSPVLFCGCAPCQPFTRQNTTHRDLDNDDRIPLLLRFADFIEMCAPDLVFVENVPGFSTSTAPASRSTPSSSVWMCADMTWTSGRSA